MDPFTIAALGLGTVGSLAGGVYDAATAGERKKEWLRRQQELAQRTALRGGRMTNFFDPRSIDAAYLKRDNERAADENFKVNPANFLPFVQNATQLAGGIYDMANKPSGPVKLPTPDALQAFDFNPQGDPSDAAAGPQGYGPYEDDPLKLNRWGRLA